MNPLVPGIEPARLNRFTRERSLVRAQPCPHQERSKCVSWTPETARVRGGGRAETSGEIRRLAAAAFRSRMLRPIRSASPARACRESPAPERESGARLSNPSQVDSSRIRLFTKFQMCAGSIVILTAALLLAPVVPLASPAAAASQPVVSSVSPGSGTIGTPVTITGSGFNYGCTDGQTGQVYFGGHSGSERDRYRRGGHSRRADARRGGGVRGGGGLPRRFVRGIQRWHVRLSGAGG